MAGLEFTVIEVTTPVTLFRLIGEDSDGAPLVDAAFRSNYELNAAPRKVEMRSAAIHMGFRPSRRRKSLVRLQRDGGL